MKDRREEKLNRMDVPGSRGGVCLVSRSLRHDVRSIEQNRMPIEEMSAFNPI